MCLLHDCGSCGGQRLPHFRADGVDVRTLAATGWDVPAYANLPDALFVRPIEVEEDEMTEDKDFQSWENETADIDTSRIDFRDVTGDAFADRHIAPHMRRFAAEVTREQWAAESHSDSDNADFEAAMQLRYGALAKD